MTVGHFLGGASEGIQLSRTERRLREQMESENLFREKGLALQERGLDLRERGQNADISFRKRTLALQEEAAARAEQRDIISDTDAAIAETMKIIGATVTAGMEAGRDAKTIKTAVGPLLQDVSELAVRIGRDPKRLLNQIDAMMAGPTPTERATAEGQATATTTLSTASALEAGGIPQDQARETAGIKSSQPKNTVLRTFRYPDGSFVSVPADDRQQIEAVLAKGGVETPRAINATSSSDLTTSPVDEQIEDVRASITNMQTGIEEVNSMLETYEKTPGAAGIPGFISDKLGGVLQQLPYGVGDAADSVLKGMGIDADAVKAARTEAMTTVARLLNVITGDESRYSDQDRRDAREALGALDASSSWSQIQASGNAVIKVFNREMLRNVDQLRIAADISARDLQTEDGINRMGNILLKNGFTEDQAVQMLGDMMTRLGVQ